MKEDDGLESTAIPSHSHLSFHINQHPASRKQQQRMMFHPPNIMTQQLYLPSMLSKPRSFLLNSQIVNMASTNQPIHDDPSPPSSPPPPLLPPPSPQPPPLLINQIEPPYDPTPYPVYQRITATPPTYHQPQYEVQYIDTSLESRPMYNTSDNQSDNFEQEPNQLINNFITKLKSIEPNSSEQVAAIGNSMFKFNTNSSTVTHGPFLNNFTIQGSNRPALSSKTIKITTTKSTATGPLYNIDVNTEVVAPHLKTMKFPKNEILVVKNDIKPLKSDIKKLNNNKWFKQMQQTNSPEHEDDMIRINNSNLHENSPFKPMETAMELLRNVPLEGPSPQSISSAFVGSTSATKQSMPTSYKSIKTLPLL